MDSATDLKPLLLLDIDGTVSPLRHHDDTTRPFTFHAGGYWDAFVYDDVRDRIGRLIEYQSVEALWLTDWEKPLCDELAVALGWPRMQRLRPGRENRPWWKEPVVRSYLDRGRRVIWADDQASARASGSVVAEIEDEAPREDDYDRPDGVLRNDRRMLLISPNRKVGLTSDDLNSFERFVGTLTVTS